jgi:RNA polymerase sigma-70 factor (ECF subfamily)
MTITSVGAGMSDTADNWPVLAEQELAGPPSGRRRVDSDTLAAELFAAHYARLAGWCRKLLDDDDTAHEIAMEAFTRLLGRLRRVDDPVGYLYVIAANLVRDHWRKTRRERELLRQTKQTYTGSGGEAEIHGTDLRTLVEALPDRQRVSVLLYYYAGFPLADVARLTNRPAGTVKSDLFQARAHLRQALDGTR